jgi:hypothetical protein
MENKRKKERQEIYSVGQIPAEDIRIFKGLRDGRYGNFGLLRGRLNGEEVTFIVVISDEVNELGETVFSLMPAAVMMTENLKQGAQDFVGRFLYGTPVQN